MKVYLLLGIISKLRIFFFALYTTVLQTSNILKMVLMLIFGFTFPISFFLYRFCKYFFTNMEILRFITDRFRHVFSLLQAHPKNQNHKNLRCFLFIYKHSLSSISPQITTFFHNEKNLIYILFLKRKK